MRVSDLIDGDRGLPQPLEALHVEGLDDPELGLEVVVDAHWSHACRRRDSAHRQAVGTLCLQNLGG